MASQSRAAVDQSDVRLCHPAAASRAWRPYVEQLRCRRNCFMIQLEYVGKQYGGKRHVTALHDVSATVTRGEMVSIVGPSGSGKSTLLNLVGGLDRPTSGEVRVDGQTLGGLRDDELTRVRRDKIGFIFQFFNLLPSLTSIENVGLPLHLRGWARRKVEDRAHELLALVGLEARLNHRPEELSGGEPQRVVCSGAVGVPAPPSRRRTDGQSRHAPREPADPSTRPTPGSTNAPAIEAAHAHTIASLRLPCCASATMTSDRTAFLDG
jgi:predicted ABC-type transport system involved in lysophospholipase L1 biosynthesis ATPase subunit